MMSPAEMDAVTAQVMSEPPFVGATVTESLWVLGRDALGRLLLALQSSRPALFWLVVLAGLGLLAVLIFEIVFTLRGLWRALGLRRDVSRGASPDVSTSARGPIRVVPPGRTSIELAWAAVDAGMSKAPATPRTPRARWLELRSALREPLRGELDTLLALHESACYAGHAVSPAMVERARICEQRLLAERA